MLAQGRNRSSRIIQNAIASRRRDGGLDEIIKSRRPRSSGGSDSGAFSTNRIGFESLERRTMMSLLGVAPDLPLLQYNSTGITSYNATTGAFDISATPTAYTDGVNFPSVDAPSDFEMHFFVSNTGALIGSAPGDDLTISGNIDVDGDLTYDYTGVLLTGEITGFGFQEAGVNDLFDMRFTVTGGALASQFAGKDAGVTVISENSTFNDSFAIDFGGDAKGTVGTIPQQVGRLSGRKFSDLTGNGPSGDDTGLGGTTINLYLDRDNDGALTPADDPIFASDVTDVGTGAYSFENLAPARYLLREVVPVGYQQTGPNPNNGIHIINVTPGSDTTNLDFHNVQLGQLGGKKFKDITGNGPSGDDTPLGGTTIELIRDANNNNLIDDPVIATTVTAVGTGAYSFSNLFPARYFVREIVPSGYFATSTITITVNVTAGSDTQNLNFTNAQKAKLTGKKFKDKKGDGLTNDDTGLSGTTIRLFRDVNNDGVLTAADGAAIASTTTGSGGSYSFDNLIPGVRYFVQEVVPSGYVRTFPHLTDTYTVILTSGQNQSGFDYANFKKEDCLCDIKDIKYYFNNCPINGLNDNTQQGGKVKVCFTVKPGASATLWLVSYTAPSPNWVPAEAPQQVIYDEDGGTFGPGHHCLEVYLPKCYYQVDFICGYPIGQFGPVGSNIFYSAQERLISADNGGTNSCIEDLSAAPSYWASSTGQNLIKKINATTSNTNPTNLASWLASQFPRMYGSSSANSFVGKRNTDVAAKIASFNSNSSKKLDAAVLAAAISAYVTKSSLAGATASLVQSYGFAVTSNGLGSSIFNVGSNGNAFGASNNSNRTVLQLLQGVNAQSTTGGSLYNGSSSLRTMAQNIFGGVNNNG